MIEEKQNIKSLIVYECYRFFLNPEICIDAYQKKSFYKKFFSSMNSYLGFISFVFRFLFKKKKEKASRIDKYIFVPELSFRKKTLIVFLSGLGCSPYMFDDFIIPLEEQDLEGATIFIPSILNRGHEYLDNIIEPILEKIYSWANFEGNKRLILVGVSNGARIAKAIEVALAEQNKWCNIKELLFISVVGAFRGSYAVNLISKFGLSFLFNKAIKEEMPMNCKKMINLEKKWLEAINKSSHIHRQYFFLAAPHDWLVPNYDSTLPKIPLDNAHYLLLKNCGHFNIINKSVKIVWDIIFKNIF
jgi:hypothetical protein